MENNNTALTGVKMMIADGIVTQEAAEKYFPELKESEDERTQLTEFLKDLIDKGASDRYGRKDFERWKFWLERQGETFTKKDVDDAYVEGMALAKHELEKQGEQKPADKVEPKFHKGDFVVDKDGRIFQIERIEKDFSHITYACSLIENPIFWFLYLEREIRKWTIQDAKDGDVLVTPLPKECEAGVQIFLFKEINSRWYAKNCVEFYCRVCQGVFKKPNETVFMGKASGTFYPATKEQRDVFFAKMREAGYEWDAKKLELKKI